MKYAADFRSLARNALKGKWGIAVVAGLIASLLGAIGSSGPELKIELNEGNFNASLQILGQDVISSNGGTEFWTVFAGIATYIAIFAIITGIALFILGSIVEVGYMKYNLDLVDRQKEAGDRHNVWLFPILEECCLCQTLEGCLCSAVVAAVHYTRHHCRL